MTWILYLYKLTVKGWLWSHFKYNSLRKLFIVYQICDNLLSKVSFNLLLSGARSQAASILMKFQELKDVQDKLRSKENELRALEEELAGLKNIAEK